jgi:hypothetical protein
MIPKRPNELLSIHIQSIYPTEVVLRMFGEDRRAWCCWKGHAHLASADGHRQTSWHSRVLLMYGASRNRLQPPKSSTRFSILHNTSCDYGTCSSQDGEENRGQPSRHQVRSASGRDRDFRILHSTHDLVYRSREPSNNSYLRTEQDLGQECPNPLGEILRVVLTLRVSWRHI